MLSEFTFISITFNHSKYILDHLESIKKVIDLYAKDTAVDLIISDDYSTDDTLAIANDWINNNRYLFRDVTILQVQQNTGVVQNIIRAIKNVKTKHAKFLAGDDMYYEANIFDLFEKLSGILVTPMIPVFEENKNFKSFKERFMVLSYCVNKSKTTEIMRYDNFIAAPCAFFPFEYLKDDKFIKFLSSYKFIEDIPMWNYLYFQQKLNIEILFEPYIKYRIGSGISTSKTHKKYNAFTAEREKIFKDFHMRKYILPKWINPWNYWFVLVRKSAIKNAAIINKLRENNNLNSYYD